MQPQSEAVWCCFVLCLVKLVLTIAIHHAGAMAGRVTKGLTLCNLILLATADMRLLIADIDCLEWIWRKYMRDG